MADSPPPVALALGAALALVTAIAPTITWHTGEPQVALPVLHGGELSWRIYEAALSGGCVLLALIATAAVYARPVRAPLALAALVGVFVVDLVTGLVSLGITVSAVDATNLSFVGLAAGSLWSLLSTAAFNLVLLLAGVRSVRPLGVPATVVGLLAVVPGLVPSSAISDLAFAVTGDPERALDPLRLAAHALRPLVMVAALPMFLRAAPLRWWAGLWPLAFVLSVEASSVLRMAAQDDPTWWTVPVVAIGTVAGLLVTPLLGRGWAEAREAEAREAAGG